MSGGWSRSAKVLAVILALRACCGAEVSSLTFAPLLLNAARPVKVRVWVRQSSRSLNETPEKLPLSPCRGDPSI